MNINLIVAVDLTTYGIGKDNRIPWTNKEDMRWFKEVTVGEGNNAVIMGRKTYESIGKPLKNRLNIIVSNTLNSISGCIVVNNINDAFNEAEKAKVESAFVIGGSSLYKAAIDTKMIDIFYIDYIENTQDYEYDTYFDLDKLIFENPDYFGNLVTAENLINYYENNFNNLKLDIIYHKKENSNNNADNTYINVVYDVINNGQTKYTRAGETLSKFAYTLSFDLRKGLPILTSKKVFSKGCIHELLWFLKGGTNIKYLLDNNVHIWDDDAFRYFIQKYAPNLPKDNIKVKEDFLLQCKEQKYFIDNDRNKYTYGDLGPIYGKQWTNWNGVNQVDELIDKLKNNPDDRRLMISAWNVGEMKDMALPPCHYMSQWYVTEMSFKDRVKYYKKQYNDNSVVTEEMLDNLNIPKKYLSCMWMQRSVDLCLGFPYDLLSYSILLSMVAQCVNMVPFELKCCLGDTHVYKNQLEPALTQIKRNPYKYNLPQLKLNKDITNIYDFTYDDIKIENYESYPTIKYILSVGL